MKRSSLHAGWLRRSLAAALTLALFGACQRADSDAEAKNPEQTRECGACEPGVADACVPGLTCAALSFGGDTLHVCVSTSKATECCADVRLPPGDPSCPPCADTCTRDECHVHYPGDATPPPPPPSGAAGAGDGGAGGGAANGGAGFAGSVPQGSPSGGAGADAGADAPEAVAGAGGASDDGGPPCQEHVDCFCSDYGRWCSPELSRCVDCLSDAFCYPGRCSATGRCVD